MSSNTKLFLMLVVLVFVFAGLALFSAAAVHAQAFALIDGASEIAGHCVVSGCSG